MFTSVRSTLFTLFCVLSGLSALIYAAWQWPRIVWVPWQIAVTVCSLVGFVASGQTMRDLLFRPELNTPSLLQQIAVGSAFTLALLLALGLWSYTLYINGMFHLATGLHTPRPLTDWLWSLVQLVSSWLVLFVQYISLDVLLADRRTDVQMQDPQSTLYVVPPDRQPVPS